MFLVRIRIDGKVRGRNIYPRFFDGYIYANSDTHIYDAVETITAELPDGSIKKEVIRHNEPFVFPVMVFDTGDWKQNKKIPEGFRNRKVIYEKETDN